MQHLPSCRSSFVSNSKLDVLAALCKVRRLQVSINALGDFDPRVSEKLRADEDVAASSQMPSGKRVRRTWGLTVWGF